MISSSGIRIGLAVVVLTSAGLLIGNIMYDNRRYSNIRDKWSELEDMVILHQAPRPSNCLSVSPFNIKVEAFLRVCNIKYMNDFVHYQRHAGGKTTWITHGSEDVGDSQLVVEYLGKKYLKDLNSNLGPMERAIARCVRILLEDHLHWVLLIDRYVDKEGKDLGGPERKGSFVNKITSELARRRVVNHAKEQVQIQGIGRQCRGDIQRTGIEDLQTISTLLGNKPYLVGDRPTEVDCTLFGFMCVIMYLSDEGSIYKTLVEKRLTNLYHHTKRMKAKFFPDWNDLIKEGEEDLPVSEPGTGPGESRPAPDNDSDEDDNDEEVEEQQKDRRPEPAPELAKEVKQETKLEPEPSSESALKSESVKHDDPSPPPPETIKSPEKQPAPVNPPTDLPPTDLPPTLPAAKPVSQPPPVSSKAAHVPAKSSPPMMALGKAASTLTGKFKQTFDAAGKGGKAGKGPGNKK